MHGHRRVVLHEAPPSPGGRGWPGPTRYKWDSRMPDELCWPRCLCGKYLKQQPEAVIDWRGERLEVRVCAHCLRSNVRPVWSPEGQE